MADTAIKKSHKDRQFSAGIMWMLECRIYLLCSFDQHPRKIILETIKSTLKKYGKEIVKIGVSANKNLWLH